jgi:hypothetical protein
MLRWGGVDEHTAPRESFILTIDMLMLHAHAWRADTSRSEFERRCSEGFNEQNHQAREHSTPGSPMLPPPAGLLRQRGGGLRAPSQGILLMVPPIEQHLQLSP